MPTDPLKIASSEVVPAAEEDRFSRFRLIRWWDQKKLSGAKAVVIGAGALGNEIIKNLALLGFGRILIADMDRIENSNLSRSVLFRASDERLYKSDVAARAAQEIYPDMRVRSFTGNVLHALGRGVFRWADVVLAGLDNREARLFINRSCWLVNRPWIDGAIEELQGVARVFAPEGPCYECTMTETDFQLLQKRRSCNLLSKTEMEQGHTPTTPTISAIIAAVQCQEAVKLLHGMETIRGRGWIFTGIGTDGYQVVYQRKADCGGHDTLQEIIPLSVHVDGITVRELLTIVRARLGEDAVIELGRDILERLICRGCKTDQPIYKGLGAVRAGEAICPMCDRAREVVTFHTVFGHEEFLDRKLSEIGVPPFDIVVGRNSKERVGFELSEDARLVMGSLWDDAEELLEWK